MKTLVNNWIPYATAGRGPASHCWQASSGTLLVGSLLFFLPSICCQAAEDLSNPEAAVESGEKALASQWDLPWYDAPSDEYKPVDLPKPPGKPWRFWEWLEDFFANWNVNLGDLLTFLGWLVVAGLLTWIVVALIRAYQRAELNAATQTSEILDARSHIERVEALPVTLEDPVGDFLQAARRAYEAGDLTRAIVYLFSYQLIELDRRSLLRLMKGKTNRQYLRELRSDSERVAPIVQRTMELFEAAFFGAHPPAKEALEECWQDVAEFQRLLVPAEEAA
jgi:hypothetical protein